MFCFECSYYCVDHVPSDNNGGPVLAQFVGTVTRKLHFDIALNVIIDICTKSYNKVDYMHVCIFKTNANLTTTIMSGTVLMCNRDGS